MPEWWISPRSVSVVVDNDSWILPYAQSLVEWSCTQGDEARLCRTHDDISSGGVAFFLGCVKITPPDILARNHANLIVHASDLPKGRGMSPWTWQILEGAHTIPLCLLHAGEKVDSGSVIYKKKIPLKGTELVADIRKIIGKETLGLCQNYLREPVPPSGQEQSGTPTYYKKRSPEDSRLDPSSSIEAQFNLLRVVDNEKYPAFFDYKGQRYIISITKDESSKESG